MGGGGVSTELSPTPRLTSALGGVDGKLHAPAASPAG